MCSRKKEFQDLDVSGFWCPNKECSDYGKSGKGNIIPKELYGKQNTLLLKCKNCKQCFSENRGTIFFDLKTPKKEIIRTLALVPEKGSIRAASRITGHDKNVICKWLDYAGKHCKEFNDYFLQDLELSRVQVDEIWAFIKKRRKT